MEACNCNAEGLGSTSEGSLSSSSSAHMGRQSSEYVTALETQIEASRVHWSDLSSDMEEQEREQRERNRRHFQNLQESFRGGLFHQWLGNDLVMGQKIAEGGQAEIYIGAFTYSLGRFDRGVILKVFKSAGASLPNLLQRAPPGLMQSNGRDIGPHTCWIEGARLLDDGRFAIQMKRYWGDLRTLIDRRMKDNHNQGPPFSRPVTYRIMWEIAQGMYELQLKDIPHRDLKASNVLILPFYIDTNINRRRHCPIHTNEFICHVADYEFSAGVQGTGFWRAPEILRAVKDLHNRPELFSESSDVYSFAMTCYEVLVGKYPFEGVRRTDYESIYSGNTRLEWPRDIDLQVKTLLEKCSHLEPSNRPTFKAISEMLEKVSKSL